MHSEHDMEEALKYFITIHSVEKNIYSEFSMKKMIVSSDFCFVFVVKC